MNSGKGLIVLMGSGELTTTMVEVHKETLSRFGATPRAVFLDTPAGFQLNADHLSRRAVEYFRTRVGRSMAVASFKSKDIPPSRAEEAFQLLRAADYILVRPGSPTYATRQWQDTPVPGILSARIDGGACLAAASAAALTVGRFTLPVYEIYKVGEEPGWAGGINVLGHFGFDLAVIPHWNNAEGGTHDTRFCFMGEARFSVLESLLPEGTGVLGLDEHTACIIDLAAGRAEVRGIGTVTYRAGGKDRVFRSGEVFPLDVLRGADGAEAVTAEEARPARSAAAEDSEGVYWEKVHTLEDAFHKGLEGSPAGAVNSVLELDRLIWKAKQDLESEEFIAQARDLFREMVVLLGARLSSSPKSREECIGPLVEELVRARASLRDARKWEEADLVRDCLARAGIMLEDSPEGTRWHMQP